MKLPSMGKALGDARETFRRFPLVIIDAAAGTAAALILVDYEGPAGPSVLFRILLGAILGIPLLFALALVAESRITQKPVAMGLQGLGTLAIVAYAFSVPLNLASAPSSTMVRFFLLGATLHLCVAALPFAGRSDPGALWRFNISLFVRLLASALYTMILFAGLVLAIASLKELFGVEIPNKRYPELWVCLIGIFLTWVFLAGVPKEIHRLEGTPEQPRWVKLFAQYAIVPLVVVYLVILYAYMVKILIAWDWPQGYVSKLIFGFAGSGIFALLLLYPIARKGESRWITLLARWFYVALAPLLVMLVLALWRRISEYGLTPGRYLAIALACWLALVVLYYLLSRTRTILFIPGSLCVLGIVMSFGPWGMLSVSERSQISRLERVAERDGILIEGKVHREHSEVPFADATEIRSILQYLHDMHGYDGIQPWFAEPLKAQGHEESGTSKGYIAVAELMGIREGPTSAADRVRYIVFKSHARDVVDLRDYEHMIRYSEYEAAEDSVKPREEAIRCTLARGRDVLLIAPSARGDQDDTLRFDLASLGRALALKHWSSNNSYVPAEDLTLRAENSQLKVKVNFASLSVELRSDTAKVTSFAADIFYTSRR
ncbi:MAG TPA: DUF4153 domain-containing protein [Bacteroidota bacterium]|nr:DUF4153 domain-containing protein [Bacteroidota bacterium]